MSEEKSPKSLIMQAVGEASMCWNETPTGVFDSTRAAELGEKLHQALVKSYGFGRDTEPADPNKKSLVIHMTTGYGKRYTCRTVAQLEEFLDNYKIAKKRKRDEDIDIMLGFGRMTQAEYDLVPECEFFKKL